MTRPSLSVVIPIALGEEKWRTLAEFLLFHMGHAKDWELILSVCRDDQQDFTVNPHGVSSQRVRVIRGLQGRAKQLNRAALVASGEWLWFLHADSDLQLEHLEVVRRLSWHRGCHEGRLYYFPIKFSHPRPFLMMANEWGANFRSRILGMPFGDQGFFMDIQTWKKCGPYSEVAPYGEDHLFVWSCHHKRVPLKCLKPALYTSARRYFDRGWFHTSLRHLFLTYRQALPQLLRLMGNRLQIKRGS